MLYKCYTPLGAQGARLRLHLVSFIVLWSDISSALLLSPVMLYPRGVVITR
jgi:hypothetical protein